MTIGNTTTASVLQMNTDIGKLATRWHDIASDSVAFFESVNKMGIPGLKALGFDDATAQKFFDTAGLMNTTGQIWFGQATQPQEFDYDDGTAEARGPQVT